MVGSPPSNITTNAAEDVNSPVAVAPDPESLGLTRVDFAHIADGQLLVYGWILGFTELVDRASINVGGRVFDLLKHATSVRRPDVAHHFSLDAGNDKHGFYALIELPVQTPPTDRLVLTVALSSGETAESLWPVTYCDGRAATALAPQATTLRELLPNLPRREAQRLVQFSTPALGPHAEAEYLVNLPPPIRFGIEHCCILENSLLLIWGWLSDPLKELTSAQVRVGVSTFDLRENSVSVVRPESETDVSPSQKRSGVSLPAFVFVQAIPQQDAQADEVHFTLAAIADVSYLRRPVSHIVQDARTDFFSLLNKMDANSALLLTERIGMVLRGQPEQRALAALIELARQTAIERLPLSIQHASPRYSLHLDQAIAVADKGIFLLGWFSGDSTTPVRIVCYCGPESFVVSDHWVRLRRADVSSHLAKEGIAVSNHDHGYSCYVPLSHGNAPYYLSAISESGEISRMRVPVSGKQGSALQTVRALLSSFNWANRDLRFLMDQHVGPAVEAVWSSRRKVSHTPVIRTYGTRPANPAISVIVPLYGRYDFAEHQMALFADDPEFQSVELIYVVDDPVIVNEFCGRCADLYGIYQVPFVVAYANANLGFAGANNLAAELARGRYLLLMNSDVMPRRHGWLHELLHIYQSLQSPGLLGVKLLYEDGSIQHVGMAFRRLPAWANLWTNHHPAKGQSPHGMHGVQPVAATTAACALIEASLYRELGGFSEDYIIGDFEDSDLCLRATLAGRRSYVALDVELYHLERQSQNRVGDSEWRTNITIYNCWLHDRRWSDLIEKINLSQS